MRLLIKHVSGTSELIANATLSPTPSAIKPATVGKTLAPTSPQMASIANTHAPDAGNLREATTSVPGHSSPLKNPHSTHATSATHATGTSPTTR